MQTIEKSAKTVEEALMLGLKELGATKQEVEWEVLDEGSKGFLGIGGRPAKVLIKKKETPDQKAKTYLREILANMGVVADISVTCGEKDMNIEVSGEKMGILIGKRGQTLDALQTIVSVAVNNNSEKYINVIIDTENYRQRRKETLESLAYGISKKVKQTKKSVVLEPMSSYERRVIHAALQNERHISTYSEGNEPHRYVVISYK